MLTTVAARAAVTAVATFTSAAPVRRLNVRNRPSDVAIIALEPFTATVLFPLIVPTDACHFSAPLTVSIAYSSAPAPNSGTYATPP